MDNLKRLQKLAGLLSEGEDFDPRLIKGLQAIANDLTRSKVALEKLLVKFPLEKELTRGSAPLKGKVASLKGSIEAFQKDIKKLK